MLGEQPGVVAWLLDQGVECDPVAPRVPGGIPRDTALWLALSYAKTDIAIMLIDRGADVNRKSTIGGHYPMHAVIEWDRDPRILESLLSHGADLTLTYERKTAMELATGSKSRFRSRYIELLNAFGKKRQPTTDN